MPDSFETIVANWATDREIPLTVATTKLDGSPAWVEAKLTYAAGGCERVIKLLLDLGMKERN